MTEPRSLLYDRHRCPSKTSAEAMWLYFRFPLSFRMVEDKLAYRGGFVTHKTIYEWTEKFGLTYTNDIRRQTQCVGDQGHLDECVIFIEGKSHSLASG